MKEFIRIYSIDSRTLICSFFANCEEYGHTYKNVEDFQTHHKAMADKLEWKFKDTTLTINQSYFFEHCFERLTTPSFSPLDVTDSQAMRIFRFLGRFYETKVNMISNEINGTGVAKEEDIVLDNVKKIAISSSNDVTLYSSKEDKRTSIMSLMNRFRK